MKNRYSFLLLLLALFLVSFRGDHDERVSFSAIAKIKQEGFNNSKVMETLFNLTDANGPRLTGSTGMKTAEKWARKQLADWGLANAAIEPWGGFGRGWETHKAYLAMTAPYYQQLIAVPRAWTPGTNGTVKAQAVLIRIDSAKDFEKYKGMLKGKIVVYAQTNAYELKVNFTADAKRLTEEDLSKTTNDTHLDDATANPNPYAKLRTNRPANTLRPKLDSFLMAEGAIAALSGGRGTAGTVFTSNGASRAWNAKPVLPEMEMGAEHINRLVRLLDAGKEVTLEMDMDNTYLMTDSVENNVVAEIPGTDLKDEVVLLGGHMDSWHGATGTTDNGAGAAVVMEAIRILKATGLRPRRTIRVILWSGEEQGLLGSHGYVKRHYGEKDSKNFKEEYSKVSAYYNLDNGGGKIRGIYMQGNEDVRPIFEAWMEPFKDLGASTLSIRNTGSTDHISFDEIGIPGFQFIQDPLEYGTRSHHTNMDTYERINSNDLMQASVIMASFVYHTAMRDEKLPRKPVVKKTVFKL